MTDGSYGVTTRNKGNMNVVHVYMNFLRALAGPLTGNSRFYAIYYAFANYLILRLKRFLKVRFDWRTVTDQDFENSIKKFSKERNYYVDRNSCVLSNVKYMEEHAMPVWFYVCSKVSLKKYKVLIVPFQNDDENTILISETMRHNLENALECGNFNDTCFLLPLRDDIVRFAAEAKVSLISNPYEGASHLADVLLANYFSVPRFLRKNDLFKIDTKEVVPEQLYSSGNPSMPVIYFKVNSMRVQNDPDSNNKDGSYVIRGKTTLILESDVHSYLPRLIENCPPSLLEPLERLERCILPFVKQDVKLRVKPIFLVKGSQGCGRRKLIQLASEKLGLNLFNVDFAEVQTLTSAQTEAKLRIVLHKAELCVPCILCLNNIQVFSKNSEGQKDERIISAFSTEVNALYDKRSEYPIVIVATSDETDIPAELQRMFVETITMDRLDQRRREDLISWLLAKRGLDHRADLSKVSGTCADFRLSDLVTLILRAVKARYKCTVENMKSLTLTQEDFDKAYEYIQSIYSDCKGTPRVPKVNWEDIGGLADLKHEIIRRIQLPLLNAFGFGQSGLLLYGPPGTGKTLLAKAVATEYQLHFLSVKGPEVLNMYVGQSEKNVRQVFERARAAAPCIIFFDELDSLAPNRGRSGDSGGVMDRVVSQLLAEMDGLESSSSIFIIGATNRPDLVDPALLRPGRFDKMLYVGIHSDRGSQLSVLKALTRKFKLREDGEELERLVDRLPDRLTGADLYAVCSDAWLGAARRVLIERTDSVGESEVHGVSEKKKLGDTITVELQDFLDAAKELVPSVSEEEAERYRRMHMELSSVS